MRAISDDEMRRRLEAWMIAQGGQAEAARVLQLTPSALSQMRSGHRPVSPRVLKVLGFRRVRAYVANDVE